MAQKVKFLKDWTFRAAPRQHFSYKKGQEYEILQAHYEAAKEAGVIEDAPESKAKIQMKPKG